MLRIQDAEASWRWSFLEIQLPLKQFISIIFLNKFFSYIIRKTKKGFKKKKARERYQDFSKEGKIKKRQYDLERHKNLLEDEKEWLFEFGKKYYKYGRIKILHK